MILVAVLAWAGALVPILAVLVAHGRREKAGGAGRLRTEQPR